MTFYNYIIGRLYSWGARKENDTPIANVVITMVIVHMFQFLVLYGICFRVFNLPNYLNNLNAWIIIAFFVMSCALYYFLFFNREKWERYAQQVEQESERKRKRGKFLVLLYLIGSILLFFISLPFVFG